MALRVALTLTALTLLPITISACGDSQVVARVGDERITKQDYDHWFAIEARKQTPPMTLDTPKFSKCVAALKRDSLRPQPTRELVQKCREAYKSTKDSTMQFLVTAAQSKQEAERLGIEVSDTEATGQLSQMFPTQEAFKEHLRKTGMTQDEALYTAGIAWLQTQLPDMLARERRVTAKEIATYHAKHKEQFDWPRRYDLVLILTSSRAKAERARAALERGDDAESVARKYSEAPDVEQTGGVLSDYSADKPRPLAYQLWLSRKPGEIRGPRELEEDKTWFVLKLLRIKQAEPRPLAEVTEQVRQAIDSQKRQAGLMGPEFRARVSCAKGYVVSVCGNAPKVQ